MEWRAAALDEIGGLGQHWIEKYGWQPTHSESDDGINLFIRMRGRRTADREFLLRLRYEPDWQVAGRRESFVDPAHPDVVGRDSWPAGGAVRGVNSDHQVNGVPTPAICVRGTWGYHSVLHVNERTDGTTLGGLLLELQKLFDE